MKSDFDGIQEEDNRLPRWWILGFVATVVAAYVYWLSNQTDPSRPSQLAELETAKGEAAERAAEAKPLTDELLVTLSGERVVVEAGAQLFAQHCVQCHGDKGQGGIGPNLTDDSWIHGARPTEIYRVVSQGVPAKGMVAWGPVLGAGRLRSVVSFVLTIKGKNVAGKAPEGIRAAP